MTSLIAACRRRTALWSARTRRSISSTTASTSRCTSRTAAWLTATCTARSRSCRKKIRFENNHIAPGSFPAEAYYRGNANAATVTLDEILGTDADFTAADREMREKLKNPRWNRPTGYTWNHAGGPGSTTMELVKTDIHSRVAHQGSAAQPRAALRQAPAGGSIARGMAVLQVYQTLRDACQAAGITQDDLDARDAPYYFVKRDSVYTVMAPGSLNFWSSPRREFVAGPRAGESETITSAQVTLYQKAGEARYGRYIPPDILTGGLIRPARFIPGTEVKELPLIDEAGREVGYVDKNGVHRYGAPMRGVIIDFREGA